MPEKEPRAPPPLRDRRTVRYFDSYLPDYSNKLSPHLEDVIAEVIEPFTDQSSSLVDIGSGTGSLLRVIMHKAKIEHLCAIDVSGKSLEECRKSIHCDTYLASICEAESVEQIPKGFDFAIVSYVLHHLIGKSRRASMRLAAQAVKNALSLVKGGGHVVIFEPLYGPAFAMTSVFYAKKLVTTFTSKRVRVFSNSNNIGAPVVSYLTERQMLGIIDSIDGCQLVKTYVDEKKPTWMMRMAGIRRWADSCLVLQKVASEGGLAHLPSPGHTASRSLARPRPPLRQTVAGSSAGSMTRRKKLAA